ncbi:redoxin domain-containing protein [Chitinophaga agrisoli]|uniref:Redoxin domain-containing protein n=1 Tax=Chitinophaga agrisoli TaxID=2607653 RepID=A0A5B2VKH5_9BACT|nr:redoxin domain-containing protein [Chitinophaga agrisoli]KAA2238792.1 redoxin domain-containing protein [Chitinophaga agrisoli]
MRAIIFIAFVFAIVGCRVKELEKTGLEGTSLPEFRLLLKDSITYLKVNDTPTGYPVVLFCFSPNCPFCRAQMEEIIRRMDLLKEIKFLIFTSYEFSEMKSFYEKYQLGKYPNVSMGLDVDDFFSKYFQIKGVPYMAIYGTDRKLKGAFLGSVFAERIKVIAEKE